MVLIDMSGRFTERMLPTVVSRLWDLREAGHTGEEIAALLGWKKSAVFDHIQEHGGIRPRWGRNLKGRSLSFEERQEIMIWNSHRLSVREIGRRLGRSHSTISRELRRNATPRQRYRAMTAHRLAFDAARRPRPGKLAEVGQLRARVQAGLKDRLSPEQISGRLVVDYPTSPSMRVSHETIYKALYSGTAKVLHRSISPAIRSGRTTRKGRRKTAERRGRIRNMTLITERPAEVENRAIPGAWEGDLIIGKANKSAIGTLVERSTGTVMLMHIPDAKHRADHLRDGLIRLFGSLPEHLRGSLTWDQGVEMHKHAGVTTAIGLPIYFCEPHSPWQRGSNENMNGLLRQYFPKGTELRQYSQKQLDFVAAQINRRPRKRYGYATPDEMIKTLTGALTA
jgi:IS30 family transposase